MDTKGRKAKGRKLQNWVAGILSQYLGNVRPAIMGETGSDIKIADLPSHLLIDIECKNQANGFAAVFNAFEQSRGRCKDGISVVVIKENRKKPLVVFDGVIGLTLLVNYIRDMRKENG